MKNTGKKNHQDFLLSPPHHHPVQPKITPQSHPHHQSMKKFLMTFQNFHPQLNKNLISTIVLIHQLTKVTNHHQPKNSVNHIVILEILKMMQIIRQKHQLQLKSKLLKNTQKLQLKLKINHQLYDQQ